MAKQYYKRHYYKKGIKNLTPGGRIQFFAILIVSILLYLAFVGYFFSGTVDKGMYLISNIFSGTEIIQKNFYGFYALLVSMFLVPISVTMLFEPKLPHYTFSQTYYTEEYFCTGCGNYLGKSTPTGSCPNCGSNRYSTEDPGAGHAVRHR